MKKANYQTLADEAGVSFKTLYRVLNQEPNVSRKTRERVLDVLAKNGGIDFFPVKDSTVLILSDLHISYLALRATELIDHLSADFNCLLLDIEKNPARIRQSAQLADIVICIGAIPDGLEDRLRKENPDLRIIDVFGRGGDISILVDECELGCAAAKYLAERGHRTIWVPMAKRSRGCESIPRNWVFEGWFRDNVPGSNVKYFNIYDCDNLFTGSERPDAVWASRWIDADQILRNMRDHNIRVPEDVSLLSTDFSDECPPHNLDRLDTVYFSTAQVAEVVRHNILRHPIRANTGHITIMTEIKLSVRGSVVDRNVKTKGSQKSDIQSQNKKGTVV